MTWIQVASMIGTLVIASWALWKEVKGLEQKIDRQAQRTDRLYEMFIDLLKEQRR